MNLFEKLKILSARLMYGRYGTDELSRTLAGLWTILLLVNILARSRIIGAVLLLLPLYIYFRVLSRNAESRRRENAVFMKAAEPVLSRFRLLHLRFRDRKTHVYRRCPGCGKVLRLPKRKGPHSVKCPKCGNDFNVRI